MSLSKLWELVIDRRPACCSLWGRKSWDTTEDWTELNYMNACYIILNMFLCTLNIVQWQKFLTKTPHPHTYVQRAPSHGAKTQTELCLHRCGQFGIRRGLSGGMECSKPNPVPDVNNLAVSNILRNEHSGITLRRNKKKLSPFQHWVRAKGTSVSCLPGKFTVK